MSHDEQRVRVMAGWIGVEISRSRVRTPGKAGYGLYRVRGTEMAADQGVSRTPRWTEWTAYAFTLEMIRICVEDAIRAGTPAGPGPLTPRAHGTGWADPPAATVPTRWTSAYRGRRDLGVVPGEQAHGAEGCDEGGPPHLGPCVEPAVVAIKPEVAAEVSALDTLVGAGLVKMVHVEDCSCDDDRYTAACIRATMPERMRQREHNAVFHAEHMERRAYGLEARKAAKLSRGNTAGSNRGSGGSQGFSAGRREQP